MIIIWLIFSAGVVIVHLSLSSIIVRWVGDKIIVSNDLSLQLAIFVILNTWLTIFSYFIYATGKILALLYVSILQIIFFIPTVYLIIEYFTFKSSGVVLATNICLIFAAIFLPFQTFKILNKQDYGIWNK